jgi:ribosomal protein L11 methyltransferase
MYIWRKQPGARWLRSRGEALTRRFGRTLALVERPRSERVLVEISCLKREQARELLREFGGSVEKLRSDWLQHSMKRNRTKALRIGSRLVITTSPARKIVAKLTLVIPAEAAFGTGEHATTAMCLRLLERITRGLPPGWSMLDAGTGSGILALTGSRFGATQVRAIDNDPLACKTAKRNADVNRLSNIKFSTGDILKRKLSGKFDVITANLYSEILIAALPLWSRHLVPGGHLILSGILRSQEAAIARALRRNRLTISEIRRRGKWVAILAVRRTTQRAIPARKRA